MSRKATVLGVLLIFLTFGLANAESKLSYKGVYTAWGQSQHDFVLGKADYNDNYIVQMFRLNLTFAASEHVKAVTRFDMAQGWWGVDNADRTSDRTGKTGGSSLFDFKDTNFLTHVDQAYIQFDLPHHPVSVKVGRMWYGLGNKMVLDNNLEGIQVKIKNKLGLGWAKVSEGSDGLTDLETVDANNNVLADAGDADVFLGTFKNKVGALSYEAFGLHYIDRGDDDGATYMPNGINYFRSRFTPHLSQLTAVGLSTKYKKNGLNVIGEVDLLFGKDDVENATIGAKQMTDVNDGNISGFNLYLKATKDVGSKFSLGGVFGMGSGDKDLTAGSGNVNKLRTSGFFYVTEVWEDSIMPDEEGITPQGLGAPNVRGYRELENTTLVQLNGTLKLKKNLSLFGSFTHLLATQAIHEWSVSDGVTTVGPASASDIGQEVDWKLDWKIYPNLIFTFRGGVFMPGDAAGYLINGNTSYADKAWETKTTITLKF